MKIGLIIIGDEILSGKRQDKHLERFIALLTERGMQLDWAQYLADEPMAIAAQFRLAYASGDLVISCGGIGATPDDHTRQAAAAALGRDLALHPEARVLIWNRIQQMAAAQGKVVTEDEPDTLRRFEMGMFPLGAEIVPNPFNMIPGFRVGSVYCLPGFPVMAHPMMAWILDTLHADLHQTPGVQERSMIVQGAMEASLTPLMVAIEQQFPGIKVFSLPSVDHPQWGRHIELGVKAGSGQLDVAYAALKAGVLQFGATIGSELVR
jgi:molybdopterin-biosynthesis enzyme MoeA-like protein